MDDFGNILYILLTIVVIIGSLFGKKKKTDSANRSKSFLEQMFATSPYNSSPIYTSEQEEDFLDFKSDSDDDFFASEKIEQKPVIDIKKNLHESIIEKEAVKNDPIIDDEEDEEITNKSTLKHFNLKDAVIYSTILETKYF